MLDQIRNSILTRSTLGLFDVLRSPVWIFDIEQMRIWWANLAALNLWNASSLEELINRDWSHFSETTKIDLQKYLQQFKQGQTLVEQWTFYPQGHPVSVRGICSGIRIEDGRLAMLVESITKLSDGIDKVFSSETQVHTSNDPVTGGSIILVNEQDIAKPNQAEEKLQYRIQFEQLITSLSTHFISLSLDQIDSGINYALKAIGEFEGVERSYIFLFSNASKTKISNSHEWCAQGIEPQIQNLQNISLSDQLPWFFKKIKKFEVVHIPDLAALPPEAIVEKAHFEVQDIQSLIVVPIVHSQSLIGFVGFDCVRAKKTWSSDSITLLRIFGEMLANTLERRRVEEELRQAEAKYRSIFENITQGIFQRTPDGGYLSANPALARLYGYDSPVELIENLNQTRRQLYVDINRHAEIISLIEKHGSVSKCESQIYRQDGSTIWISENARAVHDESGQLLYYEGTVEDITYRRLAEEKLLHCAFHDSLTGLPNRAWFMNQLEHVIALSSQRQNYTYAILFIDLDGFKVVNDSLGHLIGDKLLKSVARRLQACLRSPDKVARLGGDEFAILLEDIQNVEEATKVAERIQERLRLPFKLNDEKLFTGASIGITLNTSSYERPEELLRDADVAMYQAKALGKGRYELFNPEMQIAALTRLQLENDLRQAIELQEFCLLYQPIISLSTGRLSGFEALVRWKHPDRGWVLPAEFIPIAEETGLINSIDWWVFQEVCRQLQFWKQQFCQASSLEISVNLSASQLKQVGLVERIDETLHFYGVEGSSLKLEITESSFLETILSKAKIVKQLKALGIGLCIDDFGTGYSSLSRLHKFPIDTLKIDRSFISSLDPNSSQTAIVQTIVTLAHSLGMNVVAEGIETLEQLEKLQKLGCELGQGYLSSRPVDSQTASRLLVKGFTNLV